jgi:hypothetical protein
MYHHDGSLAQLEISLGEGTIEEFCSQDVMHLVKVFICEYHIGDDFDFG